MFLGVKNQEKSDFPKVYLLFSRNWDFSFLSFFYYAILRDLQCKTKKKLQNQKCLKKKILELFPSRRIPTIPPDNLPHNPNNPHHNPPTILPTIPTIPTTILQQSSHNPSTISIARNLPQPGICPSLCSLVEISSRGPR